MKTFTLIAVYVFLVNLAYSQWESDIRLTNDTASSGLTNNIGKYLAVSGDSVNIVWHDRRDGNFEIYYKQSTNKGITWGADFRLTNSADTSSMAGIALNASTLHVIWTDKRDGNNEIYYKHSTDGGVTWGADTRLTNDPKISYAPSIAVFGSNVHVAWADLRDGYYAIYYKRSIDGGNSWCNDIKLSSGTTFSNCPAIAVSGSDVYVVWNDRRDGNYEIYFKHSTDGGNSWGPDERLTNNSAMSVSPVIALYSSVIHIVWYDRRDGNYEIYYKQSTNKGITWGTDSRLTNATGNSYYPSVAVSGLGVHIAWQDNRNGNEEIFYKYSKDGGINWSADTLLANNMATMSQFPQVAVSGSVVHVLWKDKRDGPNGEIYYKRNPTGNLFTGTDDLKIAKSNVTVYPNPFSDYTNIEFDITYSGNVEIKIFNQAGIQIQTLKCNNCQAGRNTLQWNCLDKNNKRVSGGVYYCKVYFGKEMIVKKMIVL